MSSRIYPEHLYDKTRVELASSLIEKELRKLFLDLPQSSWQTINQSIKGWIERPDDYHLAEESILDFWDSFAAVLESIKLKPGFTSLITAENMTWAKTKLAVSDIQMTSGLEQLKKIPGLPLRNDITMHEIADAIKDKQQIISEQKAIVAVHSKDPEQDKYPIIARLNDDGLYKVMDGNRRTLKALLYGVDEIDAWVGKINTSAPTRRSELKNYWIPLNDMFQLARAFSLAIQRKDEITQVAVTRVLKQHFSASGVAEQAFINRIANQHEKYQQLYDLTKTLPD